jgi:hypothetical protein
MDEGRWKTVLDKGAKFRRKAGSDTKKTTKGKISHNII